ncbi:extracellular solute-binding protein [Paenibacillaceae bacterium]|nr:extracellular solute-binding protein [Paenibacillaceae bacterium]
MKKWLAAAMSIFIAIVVGCSSGNPAGNMENTTSSNKNKGKADEKITIKLLQYKVELTEQVKQMAEDYSKEHPNVIVEAQVSQDFETLRKTRFASGEGPDIFYLKPFTDVADWQEHLVDLSDEPWMKEVVPEALPGMTIDGKQYGFPTNLAGYGYIYNKDLFAQAGITAIPTTQTELKEVNEKLKAAGIQSFAEGYKDGWLLGFHLLNLPFAVMDDPEAYTKTIEDGTAKLKDNPYMDGYFNLIDLAMEYGEGKKSLGIDYNTQVIKFASGETAMIQQGLWALDPIVKANPNISIGMFPIPINDNPKDTRMPVDVPSYYGINKASKNIDEAKKFLIWLHENGQKYIVDSFRTLPAFVDITEIDDLGPLAQDIVTYTAKGNTMPWAMSLWPAGSDKEFAAPIQAYVAGMNTREQTIDEIQKIYDQKVRR